MSIKKEPTAMQTTKEIVNGIWTVSRDIYKGVKEEVVNSIDEETIERTKQELNLKPEEELDFTNRKVIKVYEYQKKIVKKEAKQLGLRGGLIIFGLGWLF